MVSKEEVEENYDFSPWKTEKRTEKIGNNESVLKIKKSPSS